MNTARKPLTLHRLREMRTAGEKIAMLTYDLLGLAPGKPPRFVRNFMAGSDGIAHAVRRYVETVKNGSFPDAELEAH